MKNLLISIFILISVCCFSQKRKHYRDSIFVAAQDSLKVNNIEKAYYLYSYGSRYFCKKQLKIAIQKIDSLRPVLRKNFLKNTLGKWNLVQSFYKTKIQSIEIFNDKILFNEEGNIQRIEKIVFENDLRYMKDYFELIFSDQTKWHLSLENEYLTLEFVSRKFKDQELTYSDNVEQFDFKR